MPDHQAALAHLGILQLGLQLGDVLVELLLLGFQRGVLFLEALDVVADGLLFGQRGARQVIALAAQRQLGTARPLRLLALEVLDAAAVLLAVGDAARGRGADFNQGVFHFLDHQADDLFRIFRLFQQRVDVRVDDVAQAGKNAHGVWLLDVNRLPHKMQGSCQRICRAKPMIWKAVSAVLPAPPGATGPAVVNSTTLRADHPSPRAG